MYTFQDCTLVLLLCLQVRIQHQSQLSSLLVSVHVFLMTPPYIKYCVYGHQKLFGCRCQGINFVLSVSTLPKYSTHCV